jgi:hypothetical protein
MTYCALFGKVRVVEISLTCKEAIRHCSMLTLTYFLLILQLWRVNKVLQFARVKIETWKIVAPMFVMFLASFIVLSVWSAVENYGWHRTVVDNLSGESYGNCGNLNGDDNWWWFIAIVLTAGFPVLMALLMAWKTKDVEDSFSESWWIFALVFVQFQVSLRLADMMGCIWLGVELARGLTGFAHRSR